MDPNRLDDIARLVGSGQSRRRVLKTLASGTLGAIVAAVGLDRAAASARCRGTGVVCSKNADCCSSACLPKDRTGRRYCAECGPGAGCLGGDQCHTATCIGGSCGFSVKVGVACNDSNACTTGETCQQNGTCGGGTATVCTASDQCHTAGTCDPATGACSNPTKAKGSACDDGNACTQVDTCANGVCIGGGHKECAASDQCHVAGTCDPSTGICSNPATANGTACNDANACTQTDTCQGGVCVGSNPVVCPAPADQCHAAGTCDPTTGACIDPEQPNGTACSDSNPLCLGGVCCTSGHEIVHGGCFAITDAAGTGCSTVGGCHRAGSVDGSSNYLCGGDFTTICTSNTDCPAGQACQNAQQCFPPCPGT